MTAVRRANWRLRQGPGEALEVEILISPVIVEALRACSAEGASMFALPAQNLFQWSSAAAMHSRSLRSWCVLRNRGGKRAAAGINSDKTETGAHGPRDLALVRGRLGDVGRRA